MDNTQKYFDLGHTYVHNKTATNNLLLDLSGDLIKGYSGTTQKYFDLGHTYIHNKTASNNLLLDLSGDLIKGYSGTTQKYFDLGNTYIHNKNSANNLYLDVSGELIKAYQGSTQRYFDNGNIYTFNDSTSYKLSFKYDATEKKIKAFVDGTEVNFESAGGNIFDLDYAHVIKFRLNKGQTYTVPKDGLLYFDWILQSDDQSSDRINDLYDAIIINGSNVQTLASPAIWNSNNEYPGASRYGILPVKKGDIIYHESRILPEMTLVPVR